MIAEEYILKNDEKWILYYPEFRGPGEDLQIVPVNDLAEHKFTDCVCRPKVEQDERKNGDYFYIITHNSFDGRERYEQIIT